MNRNRVDNEQRNLKRSSYNDEEKALMPEKYIIRAFCVLLILVLICGAVAELSEGFHGSDIQPYAIQH